MKIEDNPILKDRQFLLAEKVNIFHLSRPCYNDLLSFEIDFAQLCELIVLFSESQGSIAELGAFSMREELASKMLVIVRDYHLKDDSFISLGPLQHLKNIYGSKSVFILNDDETGMTPKSIRNLNLDVLKNRIVPSIDERMKQTREKTTFNAERRGHLIKLFVGMTQEFGALSQSEIVFLSSQFGIKIEQNDVDRLMLCAEAASWVKKEQRGFDWYYFAQPNIKNALVLKFDKSTPYFNAVRRREIYRDHWRLHDTARFSGIVKHAGAAK